MTCETVADAMMGLLDGTLAAWEADAVHAHLAGCPRCARYFASLREQLVLHRWAADDPFSFDDDDACLPEDVPDFAALTARLNAAELKDLGRALYEVVKAEFLDTYGDGLAAREAPISDPHAERARGSEMVDELRDWHDADSVDGIDLRDVAQQLGTGSADRLAALHRGMDTVIELAPPLAHAARYYQAIAYIKAGRPDPAEGLLAQVVDAGPPALARIARICLATLPALLRDAPDESIEALEACLVGDPSDAMVLYNLAKAHLLRDGTVTAAVTDAIARARVLDARMVDAQLASPSEHALRAALAH
jgi:tetratricopeptide (TPR) repeat protein